MQLSFICVSKYLNQRVRRIGEQNGNSLKDFPKVNKAFCVNANIKKKKGQEEIEFQNLIQD